MSRTLRRAWLRVLEQRCRGELARAVAPHWDGSSAGLRRAVRHALAPHRGNHRALQDVLRGAAASSLFAIALVGAGAPTARAAEFRYVQVTGVANPFSVLPGSYGEIEPTLADLDADGDLDLMAGNYLNGDGFTWWENTGTPTSAVFDQAPNRINGLDAIILGYRTSPSLADLDDDGDLDMVASNRSGYTVFGDNQGSPQSPNFVLPLVYVGGSQVFATEQIPGVPYTAGFGNPTLGDLDDDGDVDLVVGDTTGSLYYMENVGSAQAHDFVQRTGAGNPLDGLFIFDIGDGASASPALADLDEDGDLDLVVGQYYFGKLFYFENVGTTSAPAFVERTGPDNPLDGISVGQHAEPSFGDIDGDGDLEMITTGFGNPDRFLLFERLEAESVPLGSATGWAGVAALVTSGWARLRRIGRGAPRS
jgi:hypothetical protein